MRRAITITLLSLVALLLLVLLAGGGWLLRTNAGARWALGLAGRAVPGRLEVREIRGALASPLELRGVHLADSSLDLSVARIDARWSLAGILWGRLDVRQLEIDSVRIVTIPSPDTTHAKTPLALPDLRLPIDLRLHRLVLHGLDVRAAGDSAGLALTEGRIAGRWHEERVRFDTLAVRAPLLDADLRGNIAAAGPWRFDLSTAWTLRLPGEPAFAGRGHLEGALAAWHGVQQLAAPFPARVEARGRLDPRDLSRPPQALAAEADFEGLSPRAFAAEAPPMTLAGHVEARGEIDRFDATLAVRMRSDSLPALDLDGALGREGERVRIDRLAVVRPGKPGRVGAQGWVSGLLPAPVPSGLGADLTVNWRTLQWPLDSAAIVRSDEGRLRLRGTPRRYTLEGTARLAALHIATARLALEATGDTTHLDVSRLEVSAPAESADASGSVAWKPHVRWDAVVSASGLDPAPMLPDWPGQIALMARTHGTVVDSTLDLDAHVTQLDGMLRGLPIRGGGGVALHGKDLRADELHIEWGGTRLDLSGGRGRQWDVHGALFAPRLAILDSVARGRLNAEFEIAGAVDTPRVKLTARGDSLGFGPQAVGDLDLSAAAGLRPDDPTKLDIEARNALFSGAALDRVHLSATGTTAHHVLDASAITAGESLFVELAGDLERSNWTGALERFDLRSLYAGTWRLEQPAPIAASTESVTIAPWSLRSGASNIGGSGAWTAHHGWNADARLTEVPLALLDRFMPAGGRVEGQLDGQFQGRAATDSGPIRADAKLATSSTLVLFPGPRDSEDTLALDPGRLTAALDDAGLRAEMEVTTPRQARLSARIDLPRFDPYATDRAAQPVAGHLAASAALDALGAFLTGVREPRGLFTANLDLAGTLGQPAYRGDARVQDARVTFPSVGLTLSDIQLEAAPSEHGPFALKGSARSTKGQLTLEGSLDPSARGGPATKIRVRGQNVTVADTRDLQVRVSPDLSLEVQGVNAALSGQVDVPFARIQLASLAAAAQAPSADVVFVGTAPESAQAGLHLRSRVRLAVGDDVEIRGVGYRVKPEGNLLVIDDPDQVTRGSGELKINEGTYTAYGQDLKIDRGRLAFGGGPIANPGVDVRASRSADDGTVAGILISGTAERPVLQLFSVPAKSDADVLSYIMSGKALDQTSGLGKSTTSALGVQGGDALARSLAGQLGLGEASVESTGGMQEASLFLGTYLSPRLYMAYGIGLFEDVHTLRLRYSVASRWSIQAESGKAQSGVIQYRGEK